MIWAIVAAASLLGGFQTGQSIAQATEVTKSNGELLKFSERRGRWALYVLQTSEGDYVGNIGFCDERVWNVAIEVKSYEVFATLLQKRVSDWGQPEITFPIISQADDAKSTQEITYRWPSQRYQIDVKTVSNNGNFGTQFLSSQVATCS